MATFESEKDALDEAAMDQALAPYVRAIGDELRRHRDPNSKIMSLAYDFVDSGGKRLRPSITLLVCEALKGSYKEALPVAVAYELAHTASLTQDDIIDNSATRHNQPTAHVLYGVTAAILLSDMMIFEIFQRLSEYAEFDVTKEQLGTLVAYIAKAAKEAAEGEFLEFELSKKVDSTVDDYVRLAGLKTGALFGAAAASGAIVGGAKPRVVRDMYEFGRNLGIEFQMVDDILDLTGSSPEMGKPMLKDLQNNASNIVVIHALAHSDARTGGHLMSTMRRSAYGLTDVAELLGIFDDLGSVKFAADLSKKHAAIARARLKSLPTSGAKETLERITEWLEARRK
ncbi:MAG TPA: polyprenyl synthetase family protein [Nitrososphaerales archaeon]|nr:polyprenyl synthetase family protein [Nitrososphaerales archaeon]